MLQHSHGAVAQPRAWGIAADHESTLGHLGGLPGPPSELQDRSRVSSTHPEPCAQPGASLSSRCPPRGIVGGSAPRRTTNGGLRSRPCPPAELQEPPAARRPTRGLGGGGVPAIEAPRAASEACLSRPLRSGGALRGGSPSILIAPHWTTWRKCSSRPAVAEHGALCPASERFSEPRFSGGFTSSQKSLVFFHQ